MNQILRQQVLERDNYTRNIEITFYILLYP